MGDRAKPDPAVYHEALARLDVQPQHVLALGDLPNGATAAKAAGLWCVALPNGMTHSLPFPLVDGRLASLADLQRAAHNLYLDTWDVRERVLARYRCRGYAGIPC